MPDDLFSRFRAPSAPASTPTPASAPASGAPSAAGSTVDDDSGLAYRQSGDAGRLSEAEVLAAVDRIPSMPLVVQKLLARTGNTDASTTDLEDLIKQDMALAGRLLKLVNSPFYGLGKQVSSITQGVAIIGLASLKSLAVAASTSSIFNVDMGGYGFSDKGLWTNSCATAALAKAIAQRNGSNRDLAEEYFVAGLLRDIGMLVLSPFLAQRRTSLRRAPGEHDLLRRERSLLGFDHAWVGERVADKWNLPPELKQVIAHHHRIPPDANAVVLRKLGAIRLAERLSYAAGIGVMKDHPFEHVIEPVLIQAAGLQSAQFQDLVKELPAIIAASDLSA